jgi:hypothetical protein
MLGHGPYCRPGKRAEAAMTVEAGPKVTDVVYPDGLDDEIVKAANETSNNQISQFAEEFSQEWVAAADSHQWSKDSPETSY